MRFSDATDMRSFSLRESRLDVLNPGRSAFSRLINDAATKVGREWSRATEARLLDAAVGLADEYGERGAMAPQIELVTWAHDPLRLGEPRVRQAK